MKWSGKNEIIRGIFHVVSRFTLHFMLCHGNLDNFSNSGQTKGPTDKKSYRTKCPTGQNVLLDKMSYAGRKCPMWAENVLRGQKMSYTGRKCPMRAENVLLDKMSYAGRKCPTRAENVRHRQKMSLKFLK